jgi:MGT family glycosyltransferase
MSSPRSPRSPTNDEQQQPQMTLEEFLMSKFNALERRFDLQMPPLLNDIKMHANGNFEKIFQRLDEIESKMDNRFAELERRIDSGHSPTSLVVPTKRLVGQNAAKGVIAFCNIFATGHVNPTLPLVRLLCSAGFKVMYFTGPNQRAAVEREGAIYHNYGSDSFTASSSNPSRSFPHQLLPAAAEIMPRLLAKFVDLDVEMVLYDSACPYGYCAAKALGLPSVCSVSSFAVRFEDYFSWEKLHEIQSDPVVTNAVDVLKTVYAVEPLEPEHTFVHYTDLNLVYTSRQLNPPLASLSSQAPPESFHFVGPTAVVDMGSPSATQTPAELKDKEILETIAEKKVAGNRIVYISFGTVDGSLAPLQEAIAGACAVPDVFVVASYGKLGGTIKASSFFSVPSNALLCEYVPQTSVLIESSLFITHGGMNSVHEALLTGTPMVVVPLTGDQVSALYYSRRVQYVDQRINRARETSAEPILKIPDFWCPLSHPARSLRSLRSLHSLHSCQPPAYER